MNNRPFNTILHNCDLVTYHSYMYDLVTYTKLNK